MYFIISCLEEALFISMSSGIRDRSLEVRGFPFSSPMCRQSEGVTGRNPMHRYVAQSLSEELAVQELGEELAQSLTRRDLRTRIVEAIAR